MALTPEDRAYYEDKLGWRGYMYLAGTTMIVGALLWPSILYYQDWSTGKTGDWSPKVIADLTLSGIMLGCAMSLIMFVIARFYLWMGWLPRRH